MILTFPAIPIAQCKWALVSNTISFESELNGAGQDVSLPGDRWEAQLTITDLMGREARMFSAFMSSLRGKAGRFYLSPPGCGTPLGTAGAGLVKGATQSGSTLITDGWSATQAELFAVGDFFQVGTELKQITAKAVSNGLGEATLSFTPPLRTSPADNAIITTTNPCCIMKPVDNNQAGFELSGPRIYAFALACREPLDI